MSNWRFRVFFDSACPICRREIEILRRFTADRVDYRDIQLESFPNEFNLSREQLMSQLHGFRSNGELVTGVDVIRELYTHAGFGFFVSLTRLPGINWLVTMLYRVFAKNRLWLTGRRGEECSSDVCRR